MTDYTFEASMLRGEMADQLSTNPEQFVFVLTNALTDVDFEEALELGELGDLSSSTVVVERLKALVSEIEEGRLK